jgi:NADH-quinone oxidoreductase subunit F
LDLHFTNDQPSAEERAAVDAAVVTARRHELLPVLQSLTDRLGWISAGALNYTCARLNVPPAEAYGVASFYGLLSTTHRPPVSAHVCDDIVCKLRGADRLCSQLEGLAGAAGESQREKATWLRSPCLGLCDRAPAALVIAARPSGAAQQVALAPVSATQLFASLAAPDSMHSWAPAVVDARPERKLVRRIGVVDPASIEDYRAAGGFAALHRALELGPQRVVQEVLGSKLMGRGGAAFPTGRKWEAVASEPAQPHYMICNADESEPGTFKDRVLMEEDPFVVIEGMTIAALGGGCAQGYIYVRGEYPLAAARLRNAIEAARAQTLLGTRIGGSNFSFDIELRRGAGAYICGEETALFNSIEGLRGEPRNKPPFPVQKGLFGKPTIINNVETLANIPDIIASGGKAFATIGTPDSTGTKLFCLCGHVARPGLYEVPFGTKLSALIELAGGVASGKKLQAVLLGGAAGSFVAPHELDVALSFEGVRTIGASIGSGVVMVFDESADLAGILLRIAAFFRDESCGQCVPCRVGTVRQEELLQRLAARKPLGSGAQERELLANIGQVMRDASICGLGQTASSAIESALAKFAVFKDA